LAASVPPSRFTSSVGGGSAFYVRLPMRTWIFIILFAVVFALTMLMSRHIGLSIGSRDFVTYGWPHPWLHADVVGIDIMGKSYDMVRTERIVDWRIFFTSAGIAACIAALLSSPLFLSSSQKFRSYHARVLFGIAASAAIVWAVYPLFSRQYVWGSSSSAWQVWVRIRHPFFVTCPKWFSSGTHWSLSEVAARFFVIVAGGVLIYVVSRFKRDEKRAA
jgi:hypothetical protein